MSYHVDGLGQLYVGIPTDCNFMTLTPEQIRTAQTALRSSGHYTGSIDGIAGTLTHSACQAWYSGQAPTTTARRTTTTAGGKPSDVVTPTEAAVGVDTTPIVGIGVAVLLGVAVVVIAVRAGRRSGRRRRR